MQRGVAGRQWPQGPGSQSPLSRCTPLRYLVVSWQRFGFSRRGLLFLPRYADARIFAKSIREHVGEAVLAAIDRHDVVDIMSLSLIYDRCVRLRRTLVFVEKDNSSVVYCLRSKVEILLSCKLDMYFFQPQHLLWAHVVTLAALGMVSPAETTSLLPSKCAQLRLAQDTRALGLPPLSAPQRVAAKQPFIPSPPNNDVEFCSGDCRFSCSILRHSKKAKNQQKKK